MTAAIVALLQVSSSHQTPAAPSPCISKCSATSALIFLFPGVGTKLRKEAVGWERKAFYWPFHLPFGASLPIFHRTWREADGVDGGRRLMGDASSPYSLWSAEFRCAADSQGLGTGSGIRGQIPRFHMYVGGIAEFCFITSFLFSKGAHLRWRWLVFYKQLCVFGPPLPHWAHQPGKALQGLHPDHVLPWEQRVTGPKLPPSDTLVGWSNYFWIPPTPFHSRIMGGGGVYFCNFSKTKQH